MHDIGYRKAIPAEKMLSRITERTLIIIRSI